MQGSSITSRSIFGHAAFIVVALGAIAAFIHDMGEGDLPSLAAAAAVIGGFALALSTAPKESLARGILWSLILAGLGFLIFYDLFDFALDPVVQSDWLIAVFALFLVGGIAAALIAVDQDDN